MIRSKTLQYPHQLILRAKKLGNNGTIKNPLHRGVGWVGVSQKSCSKWIKRDATTNMWGSLSSPDCLHPLLVPQHALNPNLGHYIQSQPDSRNKWVLAEKEIPSYYKLGPKCFGGTQHIQCIIHGIHDFYTVDLLPHLTKG